MIAILNEVLLNAVTDDETTSQPAYVGNCGAWSVTVTVSNDTFTSGSVTIEGSDDETYAGTWAPIAVLSETAFTPADAHGSVLAQDSKFFVSGEDLSLPYIRTRINAAIVGGATVTTRIHGVR